MKSAISIAVIGDGNPDWLAMALVGCMGIFAVAVTMHVIEWFAGRALRRNPPHDTADDPDYSDDIGDQWRTPAPQVVDRSVGGVACASV